MKSKKQSKNVKKENSKKIGLLRKDVKAIQCTVRVPALLKVQENCCGGPKGETDCWARLLLKCSEIGGSVPFIPNVQKSQSYLYIMNS